MVPPQFTSRLGFINPGLTLIMVWSLVDSSDSWAVMLNGVIGIMASWHHGREVIYRGFMSRKKTIRFMMGSVPNKTTLIYQNQPKQWIHWQR